MNSDYDYYRRLFERLTGRLSGSTAREATAFIFAELINDALTRVICNDKERLELVVAMNQAYQDTLALTA